MRKHLFFAAAIIAPFFLIACADAGEGSIPLPAVTEPAGKYNISIKIDPEYEAMGASVQCGVKTANKGNPVTFTVTPPASTVPETDAGGGGGEDPGYYFVAPIEGICEKDGVQTPYNGFEATYINPNEFAFKMPEGDLTIKIPFTTEADPTNAFLRWLGVSIGDVSNPSTFEYTVTIPYDVQNVQEINEDGETVFQTDEDGVNITDNDGNYIPNLVPNDFTISAQAANTQARLVVQKGSPGEGDNLIDMGTTDPLDDMVEGLNLYTITVTSEDESYTNTYTIKVIKLPNLSLNEFKIIGDKTFERDLAPVYTQDVYVPSTTITVEAEAADGNASVNIDPSENISGLVIGSVKNVAVTVSKDLAGVEPEYKTRKYTLKLYYGDGVPAAPMASGGYISFVPGEGGSFDEVHTFTESGTLSFATTPTGLNAWVLVVGGGGGGSANHDPGNGGGAGGVAEHESYLLTEQSYAVVVGAGGAAVSVPSVKNPAYQGKNGGDSSFGDGLFVGYGGGGGGGGYTGNGHGSNGGSSGGSGDNNAATATKGVVPDGGNVYGNAGAARSRGSQGNTLITGGGGAGSAGNLENGGSGIISSITGTAITYAAGGGSNVPAAHATANTGNGGRGATQRDPPAYGYAGGSGVVIVRWTYTAQAGN
jgi:hypothetical protein